MTDDELIKALRDRLDAMTSDYNRWAFLDNLLLGTGYCVHCGGKLTEYTWGNKFWGCSCQRDD